MKKRYLVRAVSQKDGEYLLKFESRVGAVMYATAGHEIFEQTYDGRTEVTMRIFPEKGNAILRVCDTPEWCK